MLPGHLLAKGAKYGHERTDSPTASPTSTCVGLAIVAHFGWEFEGFDVEAAFLTGKKMSREVYFKPPKGGLPGLPAGCLLRAVKGLFGVPEAPRLWYLEISETALSSGCRRVHATPCVLLVTENTGRVCGILILHVETVSWLAMGQRRSRRPERRYWVISGSSRSRRTTSCT